MENITKKILAFEYILDSLLNWYVSEGKSEAENDFSILKALKLLFFVSAAGSTPYKHSILLEDVYDHYVAMPFGHVESQVYDYIRSKNGELNYFKIDNKNTTRKLNLDIKTIELKIDIKVKMEIDRSINFLMTNYPNLILKSAYDLVDLSHAWYSWKHFYLNIALKNSSRSQIIPPAEIKAEEKIYRLQNV